MAKTLKTASQGEQQQRKCHAVLGSKKARRRRHILSGTRHLPNLSKIRPEEHFPRLL